MEAVCGRMEVVGKCRAEDGWGLRAIPVERGRTVTVGAGQLAPLDQASPFACPTGGCQGRPSRLLSHRRF